MQQVLGSTVLKDSIQLLVMGAFIEGFRRFAQCAMDRLSFGTFFLRCLQRLTNLNASRLICDSAICAG
jgi:hypothetical protein